MTRRRHSNLGGRLIYLLLVCLYVLTALLLGRFVSRRVLIFAELVVLALLLLLYALPRTRAFMAKKRLWRLAFMVYFTPALGVITLNDYAYPAHTFSPFWGIALAVGVLIAIGVILFCTLRHCYSFWMAVLVGFFVGVMGFVLATYELGNINYAFDRAEPACEIVRICDKKVNRSSRYPDTYRFKVRTGAGSFWVEVQPGEYERYQIGEGYEVSRYRGALGEPFYLAE